MVMQGLVVGGGVSLVLLVSVNVLIVLVSGCRMGGMVCEWMVSRTSSVFSCAVMMLVSVGVMCGASFLGCVCFCRW